MLLDQGSNGVSVDTRVLLANNNKRYQAIFDGLGLLSQNLQAVNTNVGATAEVVYAKLIEVDSKLDLLLNHFGLVLTEPGPEPGPVGPSDEALQD
jgi:hypothetical protein